MCAGVCVSASACAYACACVRVGVGCLVVMVSARTTGMWDAAITWERKGGAGGAVQGVCVRAGVWVCLLYIRECLFCGWVWVCLSASVCFARVHLNSMSARKK